MSPNSLKNLREPIQKGEILNPEGARAHNPYLKMLKKLTIEAYKEIIESCASGNIQGLRDIISDPESSVLQVGIAQAFLNSAIKGDWPVFDSITSKVTGKAPEKLEISGSLNPIDDSPEAKEARKAIIDSYAKKIAMLDGK